MPILGDNEYDPAPGASYKFGAPNQIWRPQPNLAPSKVNKISNDNFAKIYKKTQKVAKFINNYGIFAKITKKMRKFCKNSLKNTKTLFILALPRSAPVSR